VLLAFLSFLRPDLRDVLEGELAAILSHVPDGVFQNPDEPT